MKLKEVKDILKERKFAKLNERYFNVLSYSYDLSSVKINLEDFEDFEIIVDFYHIEDLVSEKGIIGNTGNSIRLLTENEYIKELKGQSEEGYMNIAINEHNVAVMVDEVPENYVFIAGVEYIKEKAQELYTRKIRVEDAGLIIATALDLINPALHSIYDKLKEERDNYEREAGYAQRELDEVKEKLRLLEYDNEKLTSQLLEAQSKACERPYAHLKTENLKSRIESFREMLQEEFSSEMRKSTLSKIEEMEKELKARLN